MLYQGNCLEKMNEIEPQSVDMILCDLPYGTTCCKWDTVIPFDKLWEHYNRVMNPQGVIALFGVQPFTSLLIASNIEKFRYEWIWEKENTTGFLNCGYKPLRKTEDILIFSNGTIGSLSKNKIRYFPQGVVEINKEKKNNPNSSWRKNKGYPEKGNKLNSDEAFVQKFTNYPNNILKFARDKNLVHPTQKPVALCEYLIKTYTKEGETVLDNCMGSGTTGVACKNTNRKFIGIELDKEYFEIAEKRIGQS